MRRTLLSFALVCSLVGGGHGLAQSPASPSSLATSLRSTLASSPIPDARWSVVVIEASSGRALFAEGDTVALNPASNTKLLTAAAALSLLGPSRTFDTTVHATQEGAIARELVLRGGGDPSLRASDLDELAAGLWGAGVRTVQGDLGLDDTRFGAEHLPPAFEQQPDEDAAFRAAVSALSIDENALTLTVRGDGEGTRCAAWSSPLDATEVSSDAVVGRASLTIRTTLRDDGRTLATLTGRCAPGVSTYRRRIHEPTRTAGHAFVAALRRRGIAFTGTLVVGAGSTRSPALATHTSPPLSALLYEVGKDSNNFTAEMTLLAIGANGTHGTTFAQSCDRVLGWARAQGIDPGGMVLRNGSGLFDANRMSARQLAQVLRAAWRDPAIRDEYIAQLAVGGADGTLRARLNTPGAPRVVRAKTGTLDDAVALSGYVLTRDPSRTLIFSVLANGVRGRTEEARRRADAIVTELVRFTRGR